MFPLRLGKTGGKLHRDFRPISICVCDCVCKSPRSSFAHYLSVSLSPVDCYCQQHLLIYTLPLLNLLQSTRPYLSLTVIQMPVTPLSDQQECSETVPMFVFAFAGIYCDT